MSISAATLRRIAALALPAEKMGEVLSIIADMQEADDVRRTKQRERKARSRGKSVTVTGQERDEARDENHKREKSQTLKEKTTSSLRSDVARPQKRAGPLPADWKPSEASRARARALNISESRIDETAEDLRVWAVGKGESRADWDATFDGFIRRDAKQNRMGPGPPLHPKFVNGFARHAYKLKEQDLVTDSQNRTATAGDANTGPGDWEADPSGVLDAERSDAADGAYTFVDQ